MADETQAELNRRKLAEHLAKLKASGGKIERSADPLGNAGGAQGAQGVPPPPPPPSGWEAWKQAHGGRMHTVREVDAGKLAEAADFKILELKPGASKEEIRHSYNRLAKQFHPDLGGDAEIFQAMTAAYKRLLKTAR
jgi:DnaJ domain